MKILKKGSNTIEVYESIKELPIDREHAMNCFAILDSGVGSDMDAIALHFKKLYEYIGADQKAHAMAEAKNMHNAIYLALNKITPRSFSWVPMVKSINNKPVTDLSIEGAKATILSLSKMGFTVKELGDTITEVKKKLTASFEPSFLLDLEVQAMQTT